MKSRLALSVIALLAGVTPDAEAGRKDREPRLRDLQSRRVEIRRDIPVQADAEQAAQSYRAFLAIEDADPGMRAQALRRVGDLSYARSESLRSADDADEQAAVAAAGEAVDAYRELLQSHAEYIDADAVLYQLARAYEGSGQPALAMSTLDRLVTQYPASTHYAEAQFRRGETFFSEQRYAEAEAAYAAVAGQGAGSDFYQASLYKHAWSLFKQSRDEQSSQSFLRLLDSILLEGDAMRSFESLSRAERELVDDASRAMSISFAAADGADSLQAALQKHGPAPYESHLYASLGDLYVEKERYQDGAETYRAFARRQPMDTQAPLLLVRATNAYASGGFDSLVLEGKRELVESYGPQSTFWKVQGDQLDVRVSSAVQADLLDLARHHHAAAQADGDREDLVLAVRWYREYLAGFDDSSEAPATRLLLSDLLFENERFVEAAAEYELAAYSYEGFDQAGRAGYAALVAYQRADKQVAAEQRPALELRAIESAIRFADHFPTHEEVPGVLTRTTQLVYERGDRERAESLAQRLLALGARVDAEGQRIAWTVLAYTYFDSGRYADAELALRELAGRMPADDPERAEVTERLAASVYRQAEAQQAAGNVDAAVAEFLRVAAVAPGSSIRATAEYDAATLLLQNAQWDRAVQVLQAFRLDHPQHELQPEVTRKLAAAYLENNRQGEAAAEFERLAASDESPESRRASLWQAAELYAESGDTPAAARVFAEYVEKFPVPFEPAVEARQTLADLAAARGDKIERRRWLEDIISVDAGAASARTDRSRYLAASASLELARPLAASVRAIALTAPLDQSLLAKKRAMEAALQGFTRTTDYGLAEFTTPATYAMADLYAHMGQALLDSQRPANLSPEELEQYDILLEEQAFPFEEKAIEIHESNARLAAEGIYDESVRASFAELARLSPGRYARVETDATPAGPVAGEAEITAQFAAAAASLQSGSPDAARQQLEAALALEPGNAAGWNTLGIACRQLGDFGQAEAAYQRAIAADPLLPDPQLNVAILLDLYKGEPVRALEHYEQYDLLTGGGDADVKRWLAELRRRVDQAPRTAEVQP